MLKIREDQKRSSLSTSGRGGSGVSNGQAGSNDKSASGDAAAATDGGSAFNDESKVMPPIDVIVDNISPSLIEKNIMAYSVGSIYSSALYTAHIDEWEGFESERQNLEQIGTSDLISADEYIDNIGGNDYVHGYANDRSLSQALNADHSSYMPEPDAAEIRHLFDMMGLPLPPSLQLTSEQTQKKKVSVKMKVRMPDNSHSYLTLRAGDNIENAVYQFVVGNEMLDISAIDHLIDVGSQMLRKAEEEDMKQHHM
ncbi:unnamed protein product, partial [Symbiodinium microadriaticum]